MIKSQFIAEAKQLGFADYKALVETLEHNGKRYHKRTLDRLKQDDELSSKFLNSFEAYKKTCVPKEAQSEQQEVLIATDKPQKKVKEKTQNTKCVEPTQKKPTQKTQNTKSETQIGIDISNDEYHASEKMSVSKIKVMIDNAKEFWHKYINKDLIQKETDALIVGRLHHTLVLEPHKFDDDYIVIDMPARPVKDDYVNAVKKLGGEVELRENSKKEIVVANTVDELKDNFEKLKEKAKKTICTKAQLELAQQTSKKALNSWFELIVKGETLLRAQLKDLLEYKKCYVEKTFYGVIDGVEVQIRPDILINLGTTHDVWFVIDLKTLEVATPKEFIGQGSKFFWDMQEQFYLEVLKQNGIIAKAFYFSVAGKKEFSGAGFFDWGYTSKEEAKKVVKAGIKKYKYCVENNIFLEARFNYAKMRFEAITTVETAVYRQYQMGDLGA